MRMRTLTIALLAGLALAPSVRAQDWSGRGRVQGRVLDENKNPVEGAKVTFHPEGNPDIGPPPITTDKKGRFSYLGLQGGSWMVVIEKAGYKVSEGTIGVNEFGVNEALTIELVPNPYSAIDSGDALLDAGNFAAARAEYQKAMTGLEPARQARLRSRIGDTYLREGNYAAARGEYEQAMGALEPGEQVHLRLRLAETYFAQQQYAAARSEYEQALPQLGGKEQAQIYLKMAQTYDVEKNSAGAIDTLKRALEASPGDPAIIQLLADLLSREGREDEARTYLAQMPEGAKLPPDLVMNIGIRLYNEGDMEGAFSHFDRAVKENPDLPSAYYYRGLVYLAQKQNELAAADLRKMLELDPEGPNAAEARDFLSYIEKAQ